MEKIEKTPGSSRSAMTSLVFGLVLLIAWLMIPVSGMTVRAWTCRNSPKVLQEGVVYSDASYSCTLAGSGDADRGLFLLSLIAMPVIPLGSWLVWRGARLKYMEVKLAVPRVIRAVSTLTLVYAAGLGFLAGWSVLAALVNSTQSINGGLTSDFWLPLGLAVLLSFMTWITYKYTVKTRQIVKNSKKQGVM